jgi:hypothetical protein
MAKVRERTKEEEERMEAWKRGYEAGRREMEKEARIGKAILDVMYEIFEQKKEDY